MERKLTEVAIRVSRTEVPVEGETYSLFGAEVSTSGYYRAVGALADEWSARIPDHALLRERLRRIVRSRREIRALRRGKSEDPLSIALIRSAREALAGYTRAVSSHNRKLSLRARFDRTLSMLEEEYHLAMLEIELLTREYRGRFRSSRIRLAFLPHCLRDWSRECKSEVEGHDYVCRGCAKECQVNEVSKILRLRGVTPYLWRTADLEQLFRDVRGRAGELGVLGIACIPELIRGMRLCRRHDIPVVGLPLNANRCARWMGTFYDNSVNLDQLERILGP